MTTIATQLERDGWARIPDVVDRTIIGDLRAAIDEALDGGHALRMALSTIPELGNILAPIMAPILRRYLGPAARPVRGLVFDKVPGSNWAVPWHQDLTVAVRERIAVPGFGPWSVKHGADHAHAPAGVLGRMLSLRIHLDDADEANGALRVIPGSHRLGILDGPPLARLGPRGRHAACRAGDVLLMRPLLAHASNPARSPRHRRVVHLECAAEDLPGGLRWLEA